MLNELAKQVYNNAISKGFYENDKANNMGERLALIHSEVSEALEADRKGKHCEANMNVVNGWVSDQDFIKYFKGEVKDTFQDELADIIIRCLDTAAHLNIDIDAHVKAKMRYNSTREYMHGKKY